MSTKNIALDDKVYHKLAQLKGSSESFSKAINRLIDRVVSVHTGDDILKRLHDGPDPLSEEDFKRMKSVIEQNRRTETWELHDLS